MNAVKTILVFWIPVLAAMQGCPKFDLELQLETFAQPLVAPADAVCPDELIGTFVCRDEPSTDENAELDLLDIPDEIEEESFSSTQYLHVGRAGGKFPDGFLRFVSVGLPDDSKGAINSSSDVFFVKKVDSRFIAHLPVMKGKPVGVIEAWDEAQCRGYLLAEIRIVNDALELRYLNHELLKELIESKKIKTQKVEPTGRIITSDGKSLRQLIESYGDRMFDVECERYDRVKRR